MALRKSIVNRFTIVYLVIVAAFVAAGLRMLCIVTIERDDWMAQVKSLQKKDKVLVPERGNLYDADGQLITATIPYYRLLMDTRVGFYKTEKGRKCYQDNIDSLSICLSRKFGDKSAREYRAMIDEAFLQKKTRLVLYPKSVSYIDLMEIKKFPLFRLGRYKSGLFAEESFNRENLFGSLANRTLGDVFASSGHGQYGLELRYDSLLAGEKGMARGHLVGRGNWVFVDEKPAKRGCDIYTTIDIEMQDICETVLRE